MQPNTAIYPDNDMLSTELDRMNTTLKRSSEFEKDFAIVVCTMKSFETFWLVQAMPKL
jgi:hypothetical protein